jgi:hypothetical protein
MNTTEENEPIEVVQEQESAFERNTKKFTPALMFSMAGHLLVILILTLLPKGTIEAKQVPVVVQTQNIDIPEEQPPEPIEQEKPPIVDMVVTSEQSTNEQTTDEATVDVEQTVEAGTPDQPESAQESIGDTTNSDSMPAALGFSSGAPGGSGSNLPHGFGGRDKTGKNKGRAKYKGKETEQTVNRALKWLAAHQEEDGHWDISTHEGKYYRTGNAPLGDLSGTGIALLAFLGDGHTEIGGEYKNVVRKGMRWLNKTLEEDKANNTPNYANNYGAAIVLMALSESCIFGSNPQTEQNANRLAEWFIRSYKDAGKKEGWRYTGATDSDFSVSGWIALGLKDAKAAELPAMLTPDAKQVMEDYKKWVDEKMTNYEGGAKYVTNGSFDQAGSMAHVGMFQKHFLGFGRNDGFNTSAAAKCGLPEVIDRWYKGEEPGNVYVLYYGTLSAFQQQGTMWDNWNPIMKRRLVGSQIPGNNYADKSGSWNPTADHCGEVGGRIFTTAMLCMCLEVYYRFDSMSKVN